MYPLGILTVLEYCVSALRPQPPREITLTGHPRKDSEFMLTNTMAPKVGSDSHEMVQKGTQWRRTMFQVGWVQLHAGPV